MKNQLSHLDHTFCTVQRIIYIYRKLEEDMGTVGNVGKTCRCASMHGGKGMIVMEKLLKTIDINDKNREMFHAKKFAGLFKPMII